MNQVEDVEIGLGHNRRYKFHSGTLARNSTLFADMLTEANAAKLNSRARYAGVSVRWLIELIRLPDDEYPAGRLALVVRLGLGLGLAHGHPYPTARISPAAVDILTTRSGAHIQRRPRRRPHRLDHQ